MRCHFDDNWWNRPSGGNQPTAPDIWDNFVGPPDPDEFQDWMDENFSDRIAIWKRLAISHISGQINCETKPDEVDGFIGSDGLGEKGLIYSISLKTETKVKVKWTGENGEGGEKCDWSWAANLSALNTFGSNGGNLPEDLLECLFPGQEISLGTWQIKDSGSCDE
jgi:hypothetical protein